MEHNKDILSKKHNTLQELKSPRNLESKKNIKSPNEEEGDSVTINNNNKSPRRSPTKSNSDVNKTNNRSTTSSPSKLKMSTISVNKADTVKILENNTDKKLPINNIIGNLPAAPNKSEIIKSPKSDFLKTAKPVKPIGSSLSVAKDLHKRFSMIPIKQKNFTKTEPFQLSHTIKNKMLTNSIRKKSKTSVDLKENPVDTSTSDIGRGRPSSSRLTTRSSGMGLIDLPGMQRHRVGEVPKYLKATDKTTSGTEHLLTSKKKTFNTLKKKLCDIQSDFLQAYKAMQDVQTKINKTNGKEPNKTEIIELVAVTTDDGKLLLVKEDGADNLLKDDKKKLDNDADSNKNAEIEQKLQNITEAGYKLCKDFVNSISKLKNEITNYSENEGDKEITSDRWSGQVTEIITKMEEQIDNALKDQQNSLKEIVSQIPPKEISSKPATPRPIEHHEINQFKKSLDLYKNKCNKLETNITELTKEIAIIPDLQKQVKDKLVTITNKDHEIQRLKILNKSMDEQKHLCDTKYQSVESKLIAKELDLKKIENELQVAQNRIKSCEDVMDEVKHEKEKLFGYMCREQEISKLYELERTKCEQLRKELEEKEKQLTKAIIDFDNHKKSSIMGAGDRYNQDNQLWDEIKTIKVTLETTIKEKEAIEIQKNNLEKALTISNNDSYKMELCKSNEEISHLQKTNEVLRESLNKLEQTINRKCSIINELEQKINSGVYLTNTSKEIQNELNILRETDAEKRREIEHLKCEVAKCHIEIKQQEETIYMHQRLLRIRSELINSLQEKEASNRCRMDDLYSEVTKKSTQVNQMNHEISAKAEELQNLFSTLGTKQMELTRQEHIIKMLEENNDRNQRLRVKQEEKICRLENEISELKNIISMYQETKPSLDFKKINADFLENKSLNDLLISRDLFHNERRKKRQIEIEVKKIKK